MDYFLTAVNLFAASFCLLLVLCMVMPTVCEWIIQLICRSQGALLTVWVVSTLTFLGTVWWFWPTVMEWSDWAKAQVSWSLPSDRQKTVRHANAILELMNDADALENIAPATTFYGNRSWTEKFLGKVSVLSVSCGLLVLLCMLLPTVWDWIIQPISESRRALLTVFIVATLTFLGTAWWFWPMVMGWSDWTKAQVLWHWPSDKQKAVRHANAIRELMNEASGLESQLESASPRLMHSISYATLQSEKPATDPRALRMSPGQLLVVVNDLVKHGEDILALHSKLLEISSESIELSATLRTTVIGSAERQRAGARQVPYADIREDYEEAAKYFDGLKDYTDSFPPQMEEKRRQLAEQVPYIKCELTFLVALRDDLEGIQQMAGPWLTDELLVRIGEFVKRYEAFRETLKGLKAVIPPLPEAT